MEATIWFGGLSLFALGAGITSLEYRRKIRKIEKAHKAQLSEWHSSAFNSGWNAALQSPTAVRERYDLLFNRN